MLKKAYGYLTPQEKKNYYSPQFHHRKGVKSFGSDTQTGKKTLWACWEKMAQVISLTYSAKSKSSNMPVWNGLGKGNVEVQRTHENVLIYNEKGVWISEEKHQLDFKNVFRWTLHPIQGVISLEHLRYGPQHPVYLFDLVPSGINTMESVDAHVCHDDSYFGKMRCDQHYLQLNWRVIGPKKNEEIDYLYT